MSAPAGTTVRPLTVALLRELSHAHFSSGAVLAEKHGVSRSAVSEALKDAATLGIEIFSLTRKGYRLAAPLDLLDVSAVTLPSGCTLVIPFTLPSTNSELMQQAGAGAASGLVIATEVQSAGRGRRGRVWHSRIGDSLTFSMLWRCDRGAAQLGGLSLVVGLAMVEALREVGLTRAMLKWPNDIWVDNEKLGGVLIETQGDMLGPTAAVIGVGLNVHLSPAAKRAIDQPATAISSHLAATPSRSALLAACVSHLARALKKFNRDGFAPFRAPWLACHALHQTRVRVLQANGVAFEATVADVGLDGTLIVNRDGLTMALNSAEISLRL